MKTITTSRKKEPLTKKKRIFGTWYTHILLISGSFFFFFLSFIYLLSSCSLLPASRGAARSTPIRISLFLSLTRSTNCRYHVTLLLAFLGGAPLSQVNLMRCDSQFTREGCGKGATSDYYRSTNLEEGHRI